MDQPTGLPDHLTVPHGGAAAAPGQTTLTFSAHPRSLDDNLYVYAVLSRRARGISIGVNLNPDKVCNWDCIYCQVDRTTPPRVREVDLSVLRAELDQVLAAVASGALFTRPPFAGVPEAFRRVADISFSGDGEPTTYPRFKEAVEAVIAAKAAAGLPDLKVTVLTNATMFHRPAVREALALLDRHQGEIWAKLDAGTEAYYRKVDATTIPFARVLRNILEGARVRPIVIQSLFMRVDGVGPDAAEVAAYCDRLRGLLREGGQIKLVQVYTVARPPAQPNVSALSDAEVDAIAAAVRAAVAVPVEAYYGTPLAAGVGRLGESAVSRRPPPGDVGGGTP
ncbi:MAG: radical SAM protein [candidate division NC10 bacterium]|nr:radical SAM protein [candidate division NC10 bacterium]